MSQKQIDVALKSLAKRPKLIKGISKGTEFHKLKEIGGVSGGFIRKLWAAGVVAKEDGIVTFEKGMEKALSKVDVDAPTERKKKSNGQEEKPKRKKNEDEDEDEEDEEVDEKPKRRGKKADAEVEDEDDDRPTKKGKKEKAPKAPEVEKKARVKLVRPIKDLPANKPLDAEYYEGFWWIQSDEADGPVRIANQNLTILKEK